MAAGRDGDEPVLDTTAKLPSIREHYATFGDRLPKQLADELSALERRLG